MSEQVVSVSIKADVAQLLAGMKSAGAVVDASSKQMSDGLRSMGEGAKSANASHTGLLGVLKEFKQEQVADARIARFYAGELASVIPAGEGAKGAIGELLKVGLEAGAGGFGIGLGIEVAVLGLSTLAKALTAEEERLKAVRKTATETWNGYQDAMVAVRRSLQGEQTSAMKAHEAQLEAVRVKVRGINDEIRELSRDKGFFKEWADAWANLAGMGSEGEIAQRLAQIKAAKAAISGPRAQEELRNTEAVEAPEIARRAAAEIRSIHASTADEVARLNAELTNKLEQMEKDRAKYGATYADLRVATEQEAAEKIRRAKFAADLKYAQEVFAYQKGFEGQLRQADDESLLRTKELEERLKEAKTTKAKERITVLLELEKKFHERQQDLAEAAHTKLVAAAFKADQEEQAKSIARRIAYDAKLREQFARDHELLFAGLNAATDAFVKGVGDGFLGVIQGTKSVAQAFEDMAATMVSSIFSAMEQIAAKAAAEGIFNALFAAGTGVGGAGLLAGALGSIGSFLGLADGGSFSAGQPLLVGERGPELMVPRQGGTVIPNHALAAAGGGGITLNFHGPVFDAGGIRALPSHPDFVRGMREAVRNGRL